MSLIQRCSQGLMVQPKISCLHGMNQKQRNAVKKPSMVFLWFVYAYKPWTFHLTSFLWVWFSDAIKVLWFSQRSHVCKEWIKNREMASKTKHGVLMVSRRPISHGHFIFVSVSLIQRCNQDLLVQPTISCLHGMSQKQQNAAKNQAWCSYDSSRPISHGHFISLHFCEFDSAMQSRSYGLAKDLMFA